MDSIESLIEGILNANYAACEKGGKPPYGKMAVK